MELVKCGTSVSESNDQSNYSIKTVKLVTLMLMDVRENQRWLELIEQTADMLLSATTCLSAT